MVTNIIFALSGLSLAALIYAKVRQEKSRRKPLILRLVSLGDEQVRILSHELAKGYSDLKDEAHFFWHKQLPLHTRNFINKANTVIKEEATRRAAQVRSSKFLKRSDGLSEFFRSISEKENGTTGADSQPDETEVE